MPSLLAEARRLRQDEDGAALIMVVVIVSVLVLLSFIAFVSASNNDVSVSSYEASSQADATATAGASAAVYDIESSSGKLPCSISSTQLLPTSSGGLTNGGTSSYSVSISYYSAFPPNSADLISCSGGSVSPVASSLQAAVVTSTGKTVSGPVSSSETITEQVYISLIPNAYAVFSGGTGSLDLTHLVAEPSSTTPSGSGTVYSNGDVTLNGAPCGAPPAPSVTVPNPPSNAFTASIVAQGNLNITNCFVNGSVFLGSDSSGNGNLVLSKATVDGGALVSAGNADMSDSQVVGNLSAGGTSSADSVVVCPNPLGATPPAGCSGLQAGGSVVNGSVTAQGTVTVGTTSEPAGTPPCSTTSSGGDQIVGCITPSSPYTVHAPGDLSLPALVADSSGSDWFSAWSEAGDTAGNGTASTATVVTTSTCTGTGPGSAWADVNGETGPTVVIANCGINWTTGSLNAPYNTAIVASGGINLSGTFAFTQPPAPNGTLPTAAQISLIVPEPTSRYTCSSSLDTTLGSNLSGPNTQDDTFFVYTPCTLTISKAFNFAGELVANSLSISQNVQLSYPASATAFSPPDFNFGFQVVVESRYVTEGG
jgi:hypothetical protein